MATLTHTATPTASYKDPRRIAWGIIVAYLLLAAPFSLGQSGTHDIGDAAMGVGFLIASIVSILRWRRSRALHDACVAIAFTFPLAGMLIFVTGVVESGNAAYSWVDLFFLAAYPLMAMGLVLFPKPPATRESRVLMLFNATVAGTSTASVLYLTFGIDLLDRIERLSRTEALMAALYLFVEYTKMGKAMRAVSEDKAVARLMGIDIDRVIVFTFAIGGALAGAAGVLNGLFRPQGVFFFMGFFPGLKAFTAAVLGGIGNIPGAMFGGLFLGVFESLGPNLILEGLGIPAANQLRDAFAFTMLVLILIFRPQGIFGERLAEKKA